MTVNQEVSGVIAAFAHRRHAEHFVDELKRAGFEDAEIGLIRGHNKADDIEKDAVAVTSTGGMVGAVATSVIPGVSPLVATGLLAGMVGGTAAGAATGGILGALVGLGIPEKKARQHEQEVQSGRTIVVVQAEGRGGEALDILYRCQQTHGLWLPPTVTGKAKRSFLKKRWRGRTTASDYCIEGETCLSHGKYDEAITDFNEALHLDPHNAAAYLERGLAYAEEGEYQEAVSDYDMALRIDPHSKDAYHHRGDVSFAMGELDRAIHDYTEAIRLDPNLALAYYYRSLVYAEKGDQEQAEADQRKALELDSELHKE